MTILNKRPSGRLFAYALTISTAVTLFGPASAVTAQSAHGATTTGAGTYVCTPAGFGQKARCYRR